MSENKVKQSIMRQVLEQVPEIYELGSKISSAFLILLQKSLDCLSEYHEKQIQSLKQQLADAEKDTRVRDLQQRIYDKEQRLKEAEKVIDEVTSRCVYTYSNTQCRSARERVIEIAKLCEKHKSKYKVGKK